MINFHLNMSHCHGKRQAYRRYAIKAKYARLAALNQSQACIASMALATSSTAWQTITMMYSIGEAI